MKLVATFHSPWGRERYTCFFRFLIAGYGGKRRENKHWVYMFLCQSLRALHFDLMAFWCWLLALYGPQDDKKGILSDTCLSWCA